MKEQRQKEKEKEREKGKREWVYRKEKQCKGSGRDVPLHNLYQKDVWMLYGLSDVIGIPSL